MLSQFKPPESVLSVSEIENIDNLLTEIKIGDGEAKLFKSSEIEINKFVATQSLVWVDLKAVIQQIETTWEFGYKTWLALQKYNETLAPLKKMTLSNFKLLRLKRQFQGLESARKLQSEKNQVYFPEMVSFDDLRQRHVLVRAEMFRVKKMLPATYSEASKKIESLVRLVTVAMEKAEEVFLKRKKILSDFDAHISLARQSYEDFESRVKKIEEKDEKSVVNLDKVRVGLPVQGYLYKSQASSVSVPPIAAFNPAVMAPPGYDDAISNDPVIIPEVKNAPVEMQETDTGLGSTPEGFTPLPPVSGSAGSAMLFYQPIAQNSAFPGFYQPSPAPAVVVAAEAKPTNKKKWYHCCC